MIKMFSIMIFLSTTYSFIKEESVNIDSYADSEDSLNKSSNEEGYGQFPENTFIQADTERRDPNIRCTKNDTTQVISLNVHIQKYAVESIESASKPKLDLILSQKEAVTSYFNTIANELNSDLIKYGVQLVFLMKRYKVEDFIVTDSFDTSCEIKDPVLDRLDESFKQLKEVYQDNIGLHLFVWTCPQDPKNFVTVKVDNNYECGRAIGVLWQGISTTRLSIKSAIMEGITGLTNLYENDETLPNNSDVLSTVCKYAGQCIGPTAGVIGWQQDDRILVVHGLQEKTHLPVQVN